MIQWFRGEIEACYVGTPIAPAARTKAGAEHFKPRVYRAQVRNVVPIEPPEPAADAPDSARTRLHAERIDSAVVSEIRGPGTSYEGPIFDVRIRELLWERAPRKGDRSYGVVTGQVVAYCQLPPLPPPPQVDARLVEEAKAPDALVGELRLAPVETRAAGPGDAATSAVERADAAEADVARAVDASASPRAIPSRSDAATLPLSSVAVAVGLGLWASCGGAPALLWALFMLPTLVARTLFHGILRDSAFLRGFGLTLIILQLFCTSTLLSVWWSADCRLLQILPLLGIVAVIFPSGLLPSALPLALNAAGLALVLGTWCGGGAHCAQPADRAAPARAPSVQSPGVPRTNRDGSWPRRPPG